MRSINKRGECLDSFYALYVVSDAMSLLAIVMRW